MPKSGGKMNCLTCKPSYYAILICVSMICIAASVPTSDESYSGSLMDFNIDDHPSKVTEFENMMQNEMEISERGALDLIWPCYNCQLGPVHTSSGRGSGVMSAIDMAPNLYQNWQWMEDNSGGLVYAAHSGWVYHDSWTWQCGLKIKASNGYETHYLHITDLIDQKIWIWGRNGWNIHQRYVNQGDIIGRIAVTKSNSNCPDACNSFDESCSTGPHLHFELKKNGNPESLNGVTIGELTIQKLSQSANYDEGCGQDDENCLTIFTKGGKKYHPYYNGSKGGGFSFSSHFNTPCNPFTGKC